MELQIHSKFKLYINFSEYLMILSQTLHADIFLFRFFERKNLNTINFYLLLQISYFNQKNMLFFTVGEPKVTDTKAVNSGISPNREDNEIDLDPDQQRPGQSTDKTSGNDNNQFGNEVLIMNAKSEDRTASFFAQPGILAGKMKYVLLDSLSHCRYEFFFLF